MFYPWPETIKEAAEVLDKAKPGWAKLININTLNMQSHTKCILGQLYGDYIIGKQKLFGLNPEPAWQGTPINNIRETWISEINIRLNK